VLAPVLLTRVPFWFLRHGETDWNARNLSQGSTDVPLNVRGVEQAHAAAMALRGRGIRSIVASPLSRARDTAAIVAGALGLAVEIEPDLREVAFGAQEGQAMGGWYDDWLAGRFTPPGAETFATLRVRAAAAANRALGRTPPVLIVAHGALFRGLRAEMGLSTLVRTPNALPLSCTPPGVTAGAWELTAAEPGVAAVPQAADAAEAGPRRDFPVKVPI
jgi:broad specificity phosphatase PhoE